MLKEYIMGIPLRATLIIHTGFPSDCLCPLLYLENTFSSTYIIFLIITFDTLINLKSLWEYNIRKIMNQIVCFLPNYSTNYFH